MPAILVVDDSLMDRRLAGGLLERQEGFTVRYASDGKEALKAIETARLNVVLTDIQMPNVGGLELVKILRQKYPSLPVVVMTAQGSESTAIEALKAGAASYVPKNQLAMALVETILQVLTSVGVSQARKRVMRALVVKQIELSMENDPELLLALVEYLQDTAIEVGIYGEADHARVGVALQEALTNACFHGNLGVSSSVREKDHNAYYEIARQRRTESPYSDRRIHVSARFTHAYAEYLIVDEGEGFDTRRVPSPVDPGNLERPCGRGLLLMRTFMDEVEFNETGNSVRMRKNRAITTGV